MRRSRRVQDRRVRQQQPQQHISSEYSGLTNIIVTLILNPHPNMIRVSTHVEVIGGEDLDNEARWFDFRQVFDRLMVRMGSIYGLADVTLELSDPITNTHFYRQKRGGLHLNDIDSQFIINLLAQYQSSGIGGGDSLSNLKIVFHIIKH